MNSVGTELPCEFWTSYNGHCNSAPYSMSTACVSSPEIHPGMIAEYISDTQPQPCWDLGEARLEGNFLDHSGLQSCEMTRSPPSTVTMDFSVASSYSQDSLILQQVGSPTGFSAHEDIPGVGPCDDYGLSGLSVNGSSQLPYQHTAYGSTFHDARFVSYHIGRYIHPNRNIAQ